MNFHALSGMKDYLGSAREDLENITDKARRIFRSAGFREIETPILEDASLFDRSLGTGSDIVSKEMYTVEQSGDRMIAMRPENTAGVVRSVIENKLLSRHNQLKLFYEGPMFRHERPQSGRLREFHQVGAEVFGREDPLIDAEIIQLASTFLESVEIGDIKLLLNSIGCPNCRPGYLDRLTEILEDFHDDLCENCQGRLDTNPLRVLDCKNDNCQEIYKAQVPSILDFLCDDCDRHFDSVKDYLEKFDLNYEIDSTLVRGLDYYRRTTFEFVGAELGSQDAVLAGGRYDGLIEELGGDGAPATGFAAGLERIMILRETFDEIDVDTKTDCYAISFDDAALTKLLPLVSGLRKRKFTENERNIRVEIGDPDASVKAQFRRADRYGSRLVLLMGTDELEQNIITVKKMDTGQQESIGFESMDTTIDNIVNRLKSVNPDELNMD